MSNLDHYLAKLETIKAIPDHQIVEPRNIPVEEFVQEAMDLYKWCQEDKSKLISARLSWGFVEDLPARRGALAEAQSRWTTLKKAGDKWTTQYPQAYKLRNELLHHLRYAYKFDESLKKRLKEIGRGNGHADMLQDLREIAVLGKGNPGPLKEINFDMTQLDTAAQMAEKLGKLWVETKIDKTEFRRIKKIRDQAYTHLKEAVDEIREAGKYVFYRNDARYKGYCSEYLYKKNRRQVAKAKKKKEEKPPGPSPAPATLETSNK